MRGCGGRLWLAGVMPWPSCAMLSREAEISVETIQLSSLFSTIDVWIRVLCRNSQHQSDRAGSCHSLRVRDLTLPAEEADIQAIINARSCLRERSQPLLDGNVTICHHARTT